MISEACLTASNPTSKLANDPISPAKRRSSAKNSYKHGLTGAGVVMSDADAAEVKRRYGELMADMRPQSPAGEIAIWQMASLSYRAEKAAAYESAAIAANVRNAAEDFDEERIETAEGLFRALPEDPRSNLRKLRKSPEGIECLFDAWQDLRSDLLIEPKPEWTEEHLEQAAHMIGLKSRHARGSRFGALSRALWGDFGGLKDDEAAGLDDESRREWAKSALVEQIDAEIAEISEHYQTLDFETIALDRAEAGQRALFDTSKAGALARRYEAELRRGYYKALKEFRQVEEEFQARAQAAPPRPAPAPFPSKLGSFRETAPPQPFDPIRDFPEAPMGELLPGSAVENGPLSPGRPPKKGA